MSTLATLCVFRKWRNGDVIALFPEIASDPYGHHCVSYERIGQHGGADAEGLIGRTDAAKPAEYAALAAELARIGYVLDVRKRLPSGAFAARKASLAMMETAK